MLIQIADPVVEPLTDADVREHARIDGTEEEDLIAALITAARQWVEDYTRRRMISQQVELRRSGLGGGVYLPVAPVISVDSISYLDTANELQVLASDQYRVDLSVEPVRIVPAYLVTWPSVLCDVDTVRIRATVGYGGTAEKVPAALRVAMKMLVAHWYENREAVVVGTITADVPMAVEAILSRYIVWV